MHPANRCSIPSTAPVTVGVGKITTGGHQDIVTVYDNYRNSADIQDGDVIQVLQNDGQGNFTTLPEIKLNRRDIALAAVGDVNNDGIPDLVLVCVPGTGQYGSNPYVYDHVSQLSIWTLVGDGHGGFTPTTPAPIPLAAGVDQSTPNTITLADVDHDGFLDVVLGRSLSGEVLLAINDGTGTMHPSIHNLAVPWGVFCRSPYYDVVPESPSRCSPISTTTARSTSPRLPVRGVSIFLGTERRQLQVQAIACPFPFTAMSNPG